MASDGLLGSVSGLFRSAFPGGGLRRGASLTLRVFDPRGPPRADPAAALLEAAPQPFHQVHDFGLPRLFGRLELRGLALHLGLDDLQQVLAVFVGVLRRDPTRRQGC